MLLGNDARRRNRILDRQVDIRIGAKPHQRLRAIAVVGHVGALHIRQPDFPKSRPTDEAQMHAVRLERPYGPLQNAELVGDVRLPVRRQADIPVGLLLPPAELVDRQQLPDGRR